MCIYIYIYIYIKLSNRINYKHHEIFRRCSCQIVVVLVFTMFSHAVRFDIYIYIYNGIITLYNIT